MWKGHNILVGRRRFLGSFFEMFFSEQMMASAAAGESHVNDFLNLSEGRKLT